MKLTVINNNGTIDTVIRDSISCVARHRYVTALEANPHILHVLEAAYREHNQYKARTTWYSDWHHGQICGLLSAYIDCSYGALREELIFLRINFLLR